LKPAAFDYHRAQSLPEALALIARFGAEAKVLAGGQSLTPMLNLRLARPAQIVDLNDLVELDSVMRRGDRLVIGALTRHHRVATDRAVIAACPLLAAAAATIGHDAIRRRGTLGGSLAHADPAAQLPLVAVALDAEIHVASERGERVVRARDFFTASLVTVLEPDEMITAVHFPIDGPRSGWAYEMVAKRHGDFAVVSVVARVDLDADGRVATLGLTLGGIAPTPSVLDDAAAVHVGWLPDDTWAVRVGTSVAAAIAPDDDPRIPALYRKELAATLVARALGAAVTRAAAPRDGEDDHV
jgi:carbon-monoxide dehydrogenase medium subunit